MAGLVLLQHLQSIPQILLTEPRVVLRIIPTPTNPKTDPLTRKLVPHNRRNLELLIIPNKDRPG